MLGQHKKESTGLGKVLSEYRTKELKLAQAEINAILGMHPPISLLRKLESVQAHLNNGLSGALSETN